MSAVRGEQVATVSLNHYTDALRAVGLSGDCAADGRVDFSDGTSWRPGDPIRDERCAKAAAVLAAHDYEACLRADEADKKTRARRALLREKREAIEDRDAHLRAGLTSSDDAVKEINAEIAGIESKVIGLIGEARTEG